MTSPEVAAEDEGCHEPGDQEWWNESWYFDFADSQQELGGYFRLGCYPGRNQLWLHCAIAGAKRSLVARTDLAASLPRLAPVGAPDGATDLLVGQGESWSATIGLGSPLQQCSLNLSATATEFTDPLAVYQNKLGEQVAIEVDLNFATIGAAFHYASTTRYEISAHVTGEVRVGDEVIVVDCGGQRDHSWGVRDWWAFGWCWAAGALDDATTFHASDIRFGGSSVGFGYVQASDGLVRAESIEITEVLGAEQVPTSADITIVPPGLAVNVQPLALSPVVFHSDDGRVVRMPRMLCRFTTDDGRTGAGWVEWNQLPNE